MRSLFPVFLLSAPLALVPGRSLAEPPVRIVTPPARPLPASETPAAQPADPFGALRFLLGTWRSDPGAEGAGRPASGSFTFALELDGRVAVRRGRAEVAPRADGSSLAVHEDLTVVHPRGGRLLATYWDSEGHVIEYGVEERAGAIVFESGQAGGGPRFRLTYARRGADVVEVTFSVAPPGKDFEPHVSGLARRVRDPS